MFFLPMAKTTGGDVFAFADYWPFLSLLIFTVLATFFTISLFKHRILQIRLSIINAIVCLGFQIWIIVYIIRYRDCMNFKIASVFPLIAMILIVLAIRYIAADEAMVKSYERLRGKRKSRSRNA